MGDGPMRAQTMLDAWREEGADRMDPIRFRFIEALARRSAAHSGEAGRVLERRLAELLDAYAADLARAAVQAPQISQAAGIQSPSKPVRGALAGLVDYLGRCASARGDGSETQRAAARSAAYPELPVLDDFREIWSRMSTEKQLRQSLAQVPGNPGPLNSSSLVHRSLSLMQSVSPGYLQQFLSYIDALSWMEQITGAASMAKSAPRASSKSSESAKKPRRASGS
jgi:hypothetical protein